MKAIRAPSKMQRGDLVLRSDYELGIRLYFQFKTQFLCDA